MSFEPVPTHRGVIVARGGAVAASQPLAASAGMCGSDASISSRLKLGRFPASRSSGSVKAGRMSVDVSDGDLP